MQITYHIGGDPKDSTVLLIEFPDDNPLEKIEAIADITSALLERGVLWAGEVHGADADRLAPLLRRWMPRIWTRRKLKFKVSS